MFYHFIYLAKGFQMRPKVRSSLTSFQVLSCDTTNLILNSLDTEYDRLCVKAILVTMHTDSALYSLGINHASAKKTNWQSG